MPAFQRDPELQFENDSADEQTPLQTEDSDASSQQQQQRSGSSSSDDDAVEGPTQRRAAQSRAVIRFSAAAASGSGALETRCGCAAVPAARTRNRRRTAAALRARRPAAQRAVNVNAVSTTSANNSTSSNGVSVVAATDVAPSAPTPMALRRPLDATALHIPRFGDEDEDVEGVATVAPAASPHRAGCQCPDCLEARRVAAFATPSATVVAVDVTPVVAVEEVVAVVQHRPHAARVLASPHRDLGVASFDADVVAAAAAQAAPMPQVASPDALYAAAAAAAAAELAAPLDAYVAARPGNSNNFAPANFHPQRAAVTLPSLYDAPEAPAMLIPPQPAAHVACCYWKQRGYCKMGTDCWYAHAGDDSTPCHYGAVCKAGHAHLTRTSAAAQAAQADYFAAAAPAVPAWLPLAMPVAPFAPASAEAATHAAVAYNGWAESTSHYRPANGKRQQHQHQQQRASQPPAPLRDADFPCEHCGTSGVVKVQEFPIYGAGGSVTRGLRALCGACKRTYAL